MLLDTAKSATFRGTRYYYEFGIGHPWTKKHEKRVCEPNEFCTICNRVFTSSKHVHENSHKHMKARSKNDAILASQMNNMDSFYNRLRREDRAAVKLWMNAGVEREPVPDLVETPSKRKKPTASQKSARCRCPSNVCYVSTGVRLYCSDCSPMEMCDHCLCVDCGCADSTGKDEGTEDDASDEGDGPSPKERDQKLQRQSMGGTAKKSGSDAMTADSSGSTTEQLDSFDCASSTNVGKVLYYGQKVLQLQDELKTDISKSLKKSGPTDWKDLKALAGLMKMSSITMSSIFHSLLSPPACLVMMEEMTTH